MNEQDVIVGLMFAIVELMFLGTVFLNAIRIKRVIIGIYVS